MAIDKQKILEIIERHKGSTLYVIAAREEGIIHHSGILKSASLDSITLSDDSDGGRINTISFEKGGAQNIFHVYNTQSIDLLKAKATPPLSVKLSDRENKKIIFSRLRPQINKDLFFVYKQQMAVHASSGQFVDMGMMGIVLKLAPFYNKDLNLNYNAVLHIYTKDRLDLLQ